MNVLIETRRLIVTEPSLFYLNEAFQLDSDPEVMRFMGGARNLASSEEWLKKNILHHEKHGFGFGFVFEKSTQIFIGRGGLLYLAYNENQPDIELGYRLHQKYWGKGYATELAKALIQWGFENRITNKLFAVIHPNNTQSKHVVEKAGMHFIGKHPYSTEPQEMDFYKILSNQ